MKITTDSYGFHIAFKVPNNQTDRMETFLNTHESFMKETHHLGGDIEPVVSVSYTHLTLPTTPYV